MSATTTPTETPAVVVEPMCSSCAVAALTAELTEISDGINAKVGPALKKALASGDRGSIERALRFADGVLDEVAARLGRLAAAGGRYS